MSAAHEIEPDSSRQDQLAPLEIEDAQEGETLGQTQQSKFSRWKSASLFVSAGV